MNKSIPDQDWFGFRRQPGSNLTWPGGTVLLVSPQYTSRTCCNCGSRATTKFPRNLSSKCTSRGFEINADLNAALNMLAAGHAVSACGAERA
ncbi:MAG: transposase [Desulfovibrio sp.]|nr:transposase [Desulfovibrio sp.]